MLLSEGQMSDFKGAALMLPALPGARELLADKGYDADWFREALANRKIAAGFVRVTAGHLRRAQQAQTQAAVRPRGRATQPTRGLAFVCKLGE
jgi:hypothetical protein